MDENCFFTDYKGSETLLISFASSHNPGTFGPFEWVHSTKHLGFNRLFYRDPISAWYVVNVPHTVQFLKSQIQESKSKTVITIGASMGGFGSILFGSLLHADCAIAFSPQTYTPWLRHAKYNPYHLNPTFCFEGFPKTELDYDLIPILRDHRPKFLDLYAGDVNADSRQIMRIKEFAQRITIYPQLKTHFSASYAVQFQLLDEIILSAIKYRDRDFIPDHI